MGRRLKIPIVLGLGLLTALIAAAAFSSASVSYRSAERDGDRVAEVLIGERVVIVLRTAAGGYTALERAEIVANRLRSALAAEVGAEDVQVGAIGSGHGLYIADQLIVAVYEREADAHGASTEALAVLWGENIILALGLGVPEEPPAAEEPPASEEPPAEQPGYEFQPDYEVEPEAAVPVEPGAEAAAEPTEAIDWTGTAQKWVPIFSLETEGVYVGAAQVAGPTAQVAKVKGVAELRLKFRNIGRIYAYIPVSSISTKLDRVQGVSVWATGDLELAKF